MKRLLKIIGPGLLFASTAIGTSHFILATRAGAHYGMIFLWIIIGTMIIKYPFYEFGIRYSNATGKNLLHGYRKLGKWALVLVLSEIGLTIFAVIGVLAYVSGALLSSTLGLESIPLSVIVGTIVVMTAGLLFFGGYSVLDNFIKILSVILLITVSATFISALFNDPVQSTVSSAPLSALYSGTGLALTISLMGFMPGGLELSVFSSIWAVEKIKNTNYHPTFKESLFDFHLGYAFTTVLAIMFLMIGAFTVYGSGQILDGNSVQFTDNLINVFSSNLGSWAAPVIAITAFGTIYGSLITIWDAVARLLANGVGILRSDVNPEKQENKRFLSKGYKIIMCIIGICSYILFYQFSQAMIKMLEFVTISIFLVAPLIGLLNILVIKSDDLPESHRPSKKLMYSAYIGLALMVIFALYYLADLIFYS